MENFSIDAYTPAQIAQRVEKACISKATNDPVVVFVLAVLAGAFIAVGGAYYLMVIHDVTGVPVGMARALGGLVFSLGLVLVVVAGAELFTGNNLLVMACLDGKISTKQLLRNWGIVFAGNAVGAAGFAMFLVLSGVLAINEGAVADQLLRIATAKLSLTWYEAFFRGVLCNVLVCLAVWLCFAGHSVTDKILAIILPISAFVALGFEHSIANLFFVPAAQFCLWLQPEVMKSAVAISTWDFVADNLVPVTLGNMFGGGVLVGLVYWFNYLRSK